jgi:hypothetical protein
VSGWISSTSTGRSRVLVWLGNWVSKVGVGVYAWSGPMEVVGDDDGEKGDLTPNQIPSAAHLVLVRDRNRSRGELLEYIVWG